MPLSKITITVMRTSRRKTLSIKAINGNALIVKAPQTASHEKIREILTLNQQKIHALLKQAAEHDNRVDYISGYKILYMGGEISLMFTEQAYLWRFQEDKLVLCIDKEFQKQTPTVLKDFYNARAEWLRIRCRQLADQYDFKPKKISLRWTTSKWGSCSLEGNVSLSKYLILAPQEIQDYIIMHELCHLLQPNHSYDFYALLSSLDPLHKEHKDWLKQNGFRLSIYSPN